MNKNVRPAAVAGLFYPKSATLLSRTVAELMLRAKARPGLKPKAIIVPHAGYIYSGVVAASAYSAILAMKGKITRVVLVGSAHRAAFDGVALPDCDGMATPLGETIIDQQAVAMIKDLPQVTVSAAAHAEEHSLEVQLPFLQEVLGSIKVLPLLVGDAEPKDLAEIIDVLWGGEETLIVISSDLSHYMPCTAAESFDSQTVQHILDLEADLTAQQACGALPINGMLIAARRHGLSVCLLDLCNSGDTGGDKTCVVGYAAFALQ